MTYSLDFRMQVLKSIDDGMTFTEAAEFYNISPNMGNGGFTPRLDGE